MIGKTIGGRYQITKLLGEGGFGRTYLAIDLQLPGHPSCVVKMLQPQSNNPSVLETAKNLFDREAKVLYKLGNYPRIPTLFAHIEENGEFYLVQELIPRPDLGQTEIVQGRPMTEEKAIAFLKEVLEILSFVHQNDVIHRDLKPSNLIRGEDGSIFLIDFGAVKEISQMVTNPQGGTALTLAVGTPGYTPVEQLQGRPKPSSDIYALGVTVIQAVTGVEPKDLHDVETNEFVWRSYAPQISSGLADILDKMVEGRQKDRYQSADEVLGNLEELVVGSSSCGGNMNNNPVSPTELSLKPKSNFVLILIIVLAGVFLLGGWRVFWGVRANNFYNECQRLINNEQLEEGIEECDRALKIKPSFYQALIVKGYAHGRLKEYAKQFSSCDRALDIQGNFAATWDCRGRASVGLGDYEKGIKDYEEALNLDQNYIDAWHNKGIAFLELFSTKKDRVYLDLALEAFDEVLNRSQENQHLAWTQKCKTLYFLNRCEDAVNACDRALYFNPDYELAEQLKSKAQNECKDSTLLW